MNQKTFYGTSVFPGLARGPARVVMSRVDLVKVKNGDILIVDRATPLYASVFPKIKGLVVGEGSKLSHALVLAREYKLPCVLGIKEIFDKVKDGDKIEVDGEQGSVQFYKITANNN